MATKRPKPTATPRATAEQAIERYQLLDQVIRDATGQLDEVESALGMYMIGFHFGWKVLYMIHSKRTIAKYEAILGIKVNEVFDPVGPDADRTNAYKIINAVSNFWKVVSGDEKPPIDVDDKRSLIPKGS
jgi:hypothetical protein